MRLPRRTTGTVAVTMVAATGAALVGVGVHGISGLDTELAAAVKEQRQRTAQQHHERVVQEPGATPLRRDCPWRGTHRPAHVET